MRPDALHSQAEPDSSHSERCASRDSGCEASPMTANLMHIIFIAVARKGLAVLVSYAALRLAHHSASGPARHFGRDARIRVTAKTTCRLSESQSKGSNETGCWDFNLKLVLLGLYYTRTLKTIVFSVPTSEDLKLYKREIANRGFKLEQARQFKFNCK